jgi:hypothetical protein
MTENVVTIVVAVLASNWFGNMLKDLFDARSKKKKPADEMLLALGRRQLLQDAKTYIRLEEIPEDEFEVFSSQFEAYKKMGGNSKVRKLCEDALKMPIR